MIRAMARSTFWRDARTARQFALCADPHYVLLGLASRLAFFDLATGETRLSSTSKPACTTRVNDGRCDRQGRFVFGTKDEGAPAQAVGGFYRLNHDLSLERLPLAGRRRSRTASRSVPDGATMYYCDSPTREIRACDYRADGSIDHDRCSSRLSDATGVPDGSTVDRRWRLVERAVGRRRVVRYGPDGGETERVDVPTAQPSCVAFGGAQLGTLYVTSARIGLDAAALANDSRAGGVFIATPGRRGLPEPVFQGAPA